MSSPIEYMDLAIEAIDDKGCLGAFVMSRPDGSCFAITFVFVGNSRELMTQPNPETQDVFNEFRATFFKDVEEHWLKWIKDRAAKRAVARQLATVATQQWAVN